MIPRRIIFWGARDTKKNEYYIILLNLYNEYIHDSFLFVLPKGFLVGNFLDCWLIKNEKRFREINEPPLFVENTYYSY